MGEPFEFIERAYGAFVRSFSVPDGTDTDKVSAEFKDRILKVHLLKSEKPNQKLWTLKSHRRPAEEAKGVRARFLRQHSLL
jgi:HSP20 family protein